MSTSGCHFDLRDAGKGWGGGGGIPKYKPDRYMLPQRVRFLSGFGLKKSHGLCPFRSGIGYGFRGNYECV